MSWAGPPRSGRRLLTAIGILAGLLAFAILVAQFFVTRGSGRLPLALVLGVFAVVGAAIVFAGILRAWRG